MRTTGIFTLLGLSLLLAPAPLFAQTTVAEFESFIEEFKGDVERYHATEFASEADQDRAKDKLKRKLKQVLYAAEAEFQRTSRFDKGFSGIWNVAGSATSHDGLASEINDLEGQIKIERGAEPARIVTGEIKTPPAGSFLEFSYGEEQVFKVEFDGSETTVRKVSNRLRGWMRNGKSTINRDQTLTLETLEHGPDAELILLPSSSPEALAALGLTPSKAHGFTGYDLDGKVSGAGGSSFEGNGRFDPDDVTVHGNIDAGAANGVGTFEMSLADDGSARLTFQGEGTKGQVKLTRALAGITDAQLSDILFRLNKLNLALRYPRRDPVSYRAKSRDVMARFAPGAELDPDGIESWVIGLIDGAKTSIDLAVFEFQLMRVAEALVRAQQRGVNVRVVHDSDDNLEPAALFLHRHQVKGDANTAMLEAHDDEERVSLMHNKFMVIDGETVWTGSTNMTPNAMFAQDNNALLFHSKTLAGIYTTEFEEMFVQHLFGATDRAASANTRWSFWKDVAGDKQGGRNDWLAIDDYTSLQVYFAPEDNAMDRLLELVKGAKKSIRFMAFSYASETLAQAMKDRMADGVEVKGVFEGMGTITVAGDLYRAGADIRVKSIGNMKLHHKVIVIDDEIVCSGSFNFSDSADMKNDENMVVMRSKPLAGKFLDEFSSIYDAANANDERVVGPAEPATHCHCYYVWLSE